MTSTWYDAFFTELPNTFWRAAIPPQATGAEIVHLRHLRPDVAGQHQPTTTHGQPAVPSRGRRGLAPLHPQVDSAVSGR